MVASQDHAEVSEMFLNFSKRHFQVWLVALCCNSLACSLNSCHVGSVCFPPPLVTLSLNQDNGQMLSKLTIGRHFKRSTLVNTPAMQPTHTQTKNYVVIPRDSKKMMLLMHFGVFSGTEIDAKTKRFSRYLVFRVLGLSFPDTWFSGVFQCIPVFLALENAIWT